MHFICAFEMKLVCILSAILCGAVLQQHSATDKLEWKDILGDPIFMRFLTLATHKGRLDVVVSRECLSDDGEEALARFVQRAPFAIRLSSSRRGFCEDEKCENMAELVSSLLLLMCQLDSLNTSITGQRYVNSIVVLPRDAEADGHSIENGSFFQHGFYSHLLYNGISNIYAHNNAVYLTKGPRTECLTCDVNPLVGNLPPRRIFRQISLNGTEVRVICHFPDACERSNYLTFLEILRHKNARIREIQKSKTGLDYRCGSSVMRRDRTDEIVYYCVEDVDCEKNPRLVKPFNFDPFAYTVFVPRRNPLPKEIIFILPFSRDVWLLLFVGVVVNSVALFAMYWINERRTPRVDLVVFPLVASLLQQSSQMPFALRTRFGPKLVLLLWGILGLVTATGYKGLLISLLRNFALHGEYPDYFTVITEPDDYMNVIMPTKSLTKSASYDTVAQYIRRTMNLVKSSEYGHFKMVYLMAKFSGPCTKLVRQAFDDLGYVPTENPLFRFLSGPEIVATSPFTEALKNATRQTLEAGIFDRGERLRTYQTEYGFHKENAPSTEDALTLSDLKPFFVIWSGGLAVSALLSALELLVDFVPILCAKIGAFKDRLKQRVKRTLRWTRPCSRLFRRRRVARRRFNAEHPASSVHALTLHDSN